ncbi:MAG: hypothetical protein WCL19_11185 [Verrucomicrobiota bacterium]
MLSVFEKTKDAREWARMKREATRQDFYSPVDSWIKSLENMSRTGL